MGLTERSKKRGQVWKKAVVHFSLCFVMGFFTGFAPTGKASIFGNSNSNHLMLPSNKSEFSPQPIEVRHERVLDLNTSLVNEHPSMATSETETIWDREDRVEETKLRPRKLVIIVTPTTNMGDEFQEMLLRRLANTLRLVPQPLLWIVVEHRRDSNKVSEMLRKTGIMYRHLVFKENFTDPEAEMNHQRNVALKHIEHHRLSGIVHFAGLSNVYDLRFFDDLREIEVFGTWPTAQVTENRKKVRIEGPVCDSSQVLGWHLRKMNNQTQSLDSKSPRIHVSSFAFNSSILWDPERWGRTSSVQDTSQSVDFVKQVVLEDEDNLKGIPSKGCSKIMVWRLRFLAGITPIKHLLTPPSNAAQPQ